MEGLDVEFELGLIGEPDLARVAAGGSVDYFGSHSFGSSVKLEHLQQTEIHSGRKTLL